MTHREVKDIKVIDLSQEQSVESAIAGKDEKRVCKFVLVSNKHEIFLIHGHIREFPYHANLLDSFCDRFQISAGWIKNPDMVEIFDPDFAIKGGGWIEINKSERFLRVYGYSTAYGRYDPKGLNLVLKGDPLFSSYSVKIDV